MPDVVYVHPAKHDVDAGFQDMGFYFFVPVGVIGLVNLLRREGLSVKGINYPAELIQSRTFRLRPWLAAQRDAKLVLIVDLTKEKPVPLYVCFSFNLPGEAEKAFRQTLRVAKRIRGTYPSHMLKMINMAHTLDPCSPMSRKLRHNAIDIGLRTFMDYHKYCEKRLPFRPVKARGPFAALPIARIVHYPRWSGIGMSSVLSSHPRASESLRVGERHEDMAQEMCL